MTAQRLLAVVACLVIQCGWALSAWAQAGARTNIPADGDAFVGPVAEPTLGLCVEMRNLDNGCGPACGVYWRIALSPRMEQFAKAWRDRQVRRGKSPDELPVLRGSGCPQTADVLVVASHIDRGELLPFDLDCDTVVTGPDLALLATALAGPGTPTGGSPLCKPTDHDGDGDTDLADVAVMMQSGGPDVPTRLDYAVDAGPWTPLFGDQNLVPGGPEDTFDWAGGTSSLTFRARAAFPNFGGGWFTSEVPSDDPDRVIVLTDGMNLALTLQQKLAQPAFAGQPTVEALLLPWLVNGVVTLPADEFLVLFELNTTYSASPAFDFQDLVLKVKGKCTVGSEVVLRDSIGPDNNMTNGNFGFSSVKGPTQSGNMIVIPVSANIPVLLKSIRAISHQTNVEPGTRCWFPYDMDYKVSVYSSLSVAPGPNFDGDLGTLLIEEPAQPLEEFGNTGLIPPDFHSYTTYDGTYDFSSLLVTMLPGEERWIGLQFRPAANHDCAIIESNESGPSDVSVASTGAITVLEQLGQSNHSGRAAVEIRALTQ